jgi:hypothetical protein
VLFRSFVSVCDANFFLEVIARTCRCMRRNDGAWASYHDYNGGGIPSASAYDTPRRSPGYCGRKRVMSVPNIIYGKDCLVSNVLLNLAIVYYMQYILINIC